MSKKYPIDPMKKKPGRKKYFTDEVLEELAISLYDWTSKHIEEGSLGLLADWCFNNQFNPKYFGRYIDQNEMFKEAYDWAKAWQEHSISKGALLNSLNPRFAQFFLGCNHKWKTQDPNEDKLGTLRNEFGKFLDHIKSETTSEEEDYTNDDN